MITINAVMGSVHGWILDRWYGYIAAHGHPGVDFLRSMQPMDASDTINFYNPWLTYQRKSQYATDVVFCTHLGDREKYLQTAREADLVIVMCCKYRDMLAEHGIASTLVHPPISHKVIAERMTLRVFNPCLMAGREKRKGKALWDRIANMPGVNAVCSNGRLSEADLIREYLACDVVLSTAPPHSDSEAGPMAVVEGVALGKTCVMPASVGIVDEFAWYDRLYTYDDDQGCERLMQTLMGVKGNNQGAWQTPEGYAREMIEVMLGAKEAKMSQNGN
jgi:hypothetical protein